MKTEKLINNCYVPYSNNTAVAVVESKEGQLFPGVRIENISFPLTISAAQSAVYNCLSEVQTPVKMFVKDKASELEAFWIKKLNLERGELNEVGGRFLTDVLLNDIDIKETLQGLFKRSIVDNSDFPVACLLQTESGYISGVNIENEIWSYGLCAERVALAKAFSYGFTDFEAAYISSRDGEFCSPCGSCRQVLVEHLPNKKIHLLHPDGTKSEHFCSDLMPYSFQSSTL